ncbi:phage portal protein [Priestia megaterium]|uniref:phage portal protein n=1 Tax=Priestia megaterium TaxID=1404 RepID=UPI002E1C1971|nr:phage portal protein [Priestia megaterium]
MASLFSWGRSSNSNNSKESSISTALFVTPPLPLITEEDALKIPSVKSAIELISNSVSHLPIYLYSENEMNGRIKKVSDPRTKFLNHEANDYDTAQALKKKVATDYLLRGKAYLYKKEDRLYHLPFKDVQEELYTIDGITISRKEFVYQGVTEVTLDESEVIVIDSATNGLLVDNGQLLSIALAQLDYQQSLLSSGALPSGVLKTASRLTEPVINRLRSSWESLYSGAKKTGKTIILEDGMEYQQLSIDPDRMQFIETNKQMVSEIARIFNIPESLINSQANKYNSLEANNIAYLQNCIGPILTAIESALDKNLLSDIEKELGYFLRFDTSELLRTTEAEKIATVSAAFNNSLISFNEARAKLDMKPTEEDYYLLSLGKVLRSESGELTVLNLGQELNKENNSGGITSSENGDQKQQDSTIQ